MFSLFALYLEYRRQAPVVSQMAVARPVAAPAANDRMQAAALRLAA